MNVESLVEAASAAAAASVAVGEASRRYWGRREQRQRDAFQAAVRRIVDEALAPVLRRQTEAERRQGQHLDKQDKAIAQIRADIHRFHGQG